MTQQEYGHPTNYFHAVAEIVARLGNFRGYRLEVEIGLQDVRMKAEEMACHKVRKGIKIGGRLGFYNEFLKKALRDFSAEGAQFEVLAYVMEECEVVHDTRAGLPWDCTVTWPNGFVLHIDLKCREADTVSITDNEYAAITGKAWGFFDDGQWVDRLDCPPILYVIFNWETADEIAYDGAIMSSQNWRVTDRYESGYYVNTTNSGFKNYAPFIEP